MTAGDGSCQEGPGQPDQEEDVASTSPQPEREEPQWEHLRTTSGISNAQPDQAKNARRHLDHQDQERDQAQAAAPPTSKDEEEIPNSEEPTPGGALLCSGLATTTGTVTTTYRLQQQPLTGLDCSGESCSPEDGSSQEAEGAGQPDQEEDSAPILQPP